MNQFQDILDEALEAMLNRGASVDECCQRFPEAAAQLRPLVSLAAQGRQSLSVTMPPAARASVRQRVMTKAQTAGARAAVPVWRKFRRLALRPLVLAGAILALGASTAVAATQAGPDSFLYPVKTGLESARTTLAWQNLDQAAVETGYANRRLDEIREMSDSDKAGYIPGLLDSYHGHINTAQSLVDQARADGEDTSEVEAMIEATRARQRQLLVDIEDRLPEEVRQAISEDLEQARDESSGEQPEFDDQPGTGGAYSPVPSAPAPARGDESDDDYYHPSGDGDGYDDDYSGGGGSGSGYPEEPGDGEDSIDDSENGDHPVGSQQPEDGPRDD